MTAHLEQAQNAVTDLRNRLNALAVNKSHLADKLEQSQKLEESLLDTLGDVDSRTKARQDSSSARDLLVSAERKRAELSEKLTAAEKLLRHEQDLAAMLESCAAYQDGQSVVVEAFNEAAQALRPHFDRLLEAAEALDAPEEIYNQIGKSLLPGYQSRMATAVGIGKTTPKAAGQPSRMKSEHAAARRLHRSPHPPPQWKRCCSRFF